MNCNELREHYERYAAGLAEEPELSEIRAHLERQCEVCVEGVRRARETAALPGGTATPDAPSPGLRRRIPAAEGRERSGYGWILALSGALAFSLIACFYFAGRERDIAREVVRITGINRWQKIDLSRWNDVFAIIASADTRIRTFGRGKVFVNPSQGVVLMAVNLPKAPAGKAYEMWLIPTDSKPVPAGVFQSSDEGSAIHMWRGSVDPAAGMVAVTIEDAGGVASPTTAPLFTVPIQGLDK